MNKPSSFLGLLPKHPEEIYASQAASPNNTKYSCWNLFPNTPWYNKLDQMPFSFIPLQHFFLEVHPSASSTKSASGFEQTFAFLHRCHWSVRVERLINQPYANHQLTAGLSAAVNTTGKRPSISCLWVGSMQFMKGYNQHGNIIPSI